MSRRIAALILVLSLLGIPREAPVAAAPAPDPAVAELRFAEARIAADKGRQADVVRLCTAALKANRRHLGARHLRGVTYAAMGRWHDAERDLMRLSYRRPRDLALLRLLARSLVEQKKWMWAARMYRRTLQLAPNAGDLWLGFGYSLYRLGEKEEARDALRKARKLGPRGVRNTAQVLLAIQLQQAGKLKEARRLAGAVRGPGHSEAEQLTALIYASQGRSERGLHLSFRLGTGYDSNVSMDPADSRGSGSMGWMQRLGASLKWQAFAWGRYRVGVNAALSRTFALNWWDEGSCVPDYSTLAGAISPWWAVRFATGRVDHELRLAYRGQLITLDGDCTEDGSFYVFSESHGGSALWEIQWTDRTSTHVLVDLGYAMFHQQVRDQLQLTFEVGQSVFLLSRRLKLYPELHVRYEHARGTWWTAAAVRPSLSLSSLLPGKVDLVGSVGLEVLHFPDSASYRPWQTGGNRTDVILRAEVQVGRTLTSWLRADLAYRYRLNHSNSRVWDYQRHEVGITFTAQVDLFGPKKPKPAKPPRPRPEGGA